MPKAAALCALFVLLTVLLPALALLPAKEEGTTAPQSSFPVTQAETDSAQELLPQQQPEQTLTVWDEATNSAVTLGMRQYLISALLCEMPLTFHDEALKAQVVVTHSYALYCTALRRAQPMDELQGAAFTVNSAACEGLMSEQQAKARFGSGYYLSVEKAAAIVDSVLPLLLTYGGEPIAAAYHAISAGYTEQSGNVWSTALPYLVSVESAADKEAAGYESSVSVPLTEFCAALHGLNAAFSPQDDPASWVQGLQRSEAGYVLQLSVCGVPFTGSALRQAFSLRSSCFTLQLTQEQAVFTVYGYGHGVGMSQTGADAMARAGSSFADILAHYYPGTRLTEA